MHVKSCAIHYFWLATANRRNGRKHFVEISKGSETHLPFFFSYGSLIVVSSVAFNLRSSLVVVLIYEDRKPIW